MVVATPPERLADGGMAVDTDTQTPLTDDRSYPFGFMIAPAFVGGLIWLCAMLARLAP